MQHLQDYVGLAEKFSRANSDAVQLAQWLFRTLASPFNRRSLTKMQGFEIETLKNLALFFKKKVLKPLPDIHFTLIQQALCKQEVGTGSSKS